MKKTLGLLLAILLTLSMSAMAETLTGTSAGFGGDVTVTLTMDGDKIVDCAIEGSGETPTVGGAAFEALAAQVVASGSADIDGVAGATFTSEGVRSAVRAALGETSATGEKAALNPGTYTGSANGMNDRVEVSLTVTEDAITAAEVTFQQETKGIGSPLLNKNDEQLDNGGKIPTLYLPEQIVEHQSLNVDIVTGATVTSHAVLAAAADALKQAGGDPEQWKEEVPVVVAEHEHQADVIVVGGGGSGLTAAITASDSGASVIVIEKNGAMGGDTVVCGAVYNSCDREGQKALEMDDNYVTTLETALNETPVDDAHAALTREMHEYGFSVAQDQAVVLYLDIGNPWVGTRKRFIWLTIPLRYSCRLWQINQTNYNIKMRRADMLSDTFVVK